MSALELSPAAELWLAAVAGALLHFLWQGVAIAVAYAAACRLFGAQRPQVRVLAGYLALAAMALAPPATMAWLLAGSDGTAAALPPATVLASSAGLAGETAARAIAWAPGLVGAWLLGVAVVSARGFRHWIALRGVRLRAGDANPGWQLALARLATEFGLRMRIELKVSAEIATPILVGWLKPAILLPAAMCARLPRDQVELLIAHELAHVRRFDHLFNLLQIAVETLLFYHPLVHWVSRRVRDDREQCCDDLVTRRLGGRLAYARALLSVAESAHGTRPAVALSAAGGQLFSRIARIVEAGVDTDQRSNLPQALLLIGALGLATLVAGRLAGVVPAQGMVPVPVPAALSLVGLRPPPAPLPVADLVAEITGLAPRVPATAAEPARDRAPPPTAMPREAVEAPVPATTGPEPAVAAGEVASIDFVPVAAALPEAPVTVLQREPVPVHTPAPEYPLRARARGIEGSVTLSYRVGAEGQVTDIAVESAQPAGVFEQAAREAVSSWRFAPGDAGGERFQQVIEFRLQSDQDEPFCKRRTGTQICE